MPDLDAFEARLGHRFSNPALLRVALTHSSAMHDLGTSIQDNQRLEFLGDSVLSLTITRELFDKFPWLDEGRLTPMRAQLVNQRSLAGIAMLLGLGQFLVLSRSEEANGGRERPNILADCYEAVIGAVLLDSDYEAASRVVLRHFRDGWGSFDAGIHIENPKGDLQEMLQADASEAPQYRTESSEGPDHDRVFVCSVWHRGAELARGRGKSKKAAESEAALAALGKLRKAAT
jgi:ribonuclease-3